MINYFFFPSIKGSVYGQILKMRMEVPWHEESLVEYTHLIPGDKHAVHVEAPHFGFSQDNKWGSPHLGWRPFGMFDENKNEYPPFCQTNKKKEEIH